MELTTNELVVFIVAAVCFVVCVLVAALLTNRPKVSSIVMTIIGLAVFVWKLTETIYFFVGDHIIGQGLAPIELSHWAYLILGVVLIFSIKPLYLPTGLLCIFSALGFLIGCFASPSSFDYTDYHFYLSVVSHLALLLSGFLLTFNVRRYKATDSIFSLIGVGLFAVYGVFLVNGYIYPDHQGYVQSSIIYEIFTGELLTHVMDAAEIELWMELLVPVCILALAIILLFVFYGINHALYRSRAKRVNLKPEEYPRTPVGLFELIKYAATGRKDHRELLVYKLSGLNA